MDGAGLVLTRRTHEAIWIAPGTADAVRIEIAEIREGKVRLRIQAPRHIAVHRDEVWRDIVLEERGEGK